MYTNCTTLYANPYHNAHLMSQKRRKFATIVPATLPVRSASQGWSFTFPPSFKCRIAKPGRPFEGECGLESHRGFMTYIMLNSVLSFLLISLNRK